MQDLQVDKRNSNNSFSSKRTSLRISTATINSDTAIPPPVHFTTTINDPPMPVRRNSSRSKYYQRSIKNLNYPFETKSINLDENYSLLDNLTGNMEELKHLNPLLNPYDTSWVPEPYSSSPILSKFSLLDSNKIRFITHSSNLSQIDESQVDESQESQIDESQLQYASSSGSEDNNYVNNDLNASEKGEEYKSNKLNSWKKLWEMPWRDIETKKFTKKFCKSIHQMLPNNAKQK
ncbi:12251_t:CDS:2 [Rhizophagus irregularis]|nr:12251_t:CDS:2 [Rhizophagus irregularis]